MEKKRCPNCGKYVDADKTYCMNCGTTLGIRCPDCQAILPVGTKRCTACGHSFLRKTPRKPSVTAAFIRAHQRAVAVMLTLSALLAAAFLAALPALRVSSGAVPVTDMRACGYALIGFLLGAHPSGIVALLAQPALRDISAGLRFTLYGAGLGWLILLTGSALALWLAVANRKRLGKLTGRRLLLLSGISFGGGILVVGMEAVTRTLLPDAAETARWTSSAAVPFAAGAVALLLFAALAWLYATILRNTDESSETALSPRQALYYPFRTLARAIRRRFSRKSRATHAQAQGEHTLTCTRRFHRYLILLGAALIFTQALLSKVSNIFFWFLLLLPVPLLLYTLVARHAVTAVMRSASVTTEKNEPYTYELCIRNRSLLVFPFVEAHVSLPQSNAVRCTERTLCLPLTALSDRCLRDTVRFRFRGTYEIGADELYVYDFFRLFRVRIPVKAMATVYVLPRRTAIEETLALSVSDSAARTVHALTAVDRLEVSDIREYRAGDSLKSIHWKLSSKSEEFVVKDYNTGTSDQTVVFCDLAPHFPDREPHRDAATDAPEQTGENSKKRGGKRLRRQATTARRAKRNAQTADTHAISDEQLAQRLSERAAAAEFLSERLTDKQVPDAADNVMDAQGDLGETPVVQDVQALASPDFYADMNEYLADGTVELTIAVVLSELNRGHEVQLVWFDRRSESGMYAFRLRGTDEFERIYSLFGTAPLCRADQSVPLLASMIQETGSMRQLFVLPAMDEATLTALCCLPGIADIGGADGVEALLYEPAERFRYPAARTRFLENCRQQLGAAGVSLVVCGTVPEQNATDAVRQCEKGGDADA